MTSDDKRALNKARSEARLAAVQALYQMEMSSSDANDVIDEFLTHRFATEAIHYSNPDTEHFRDVVRGVVAHQTDIDRAIEDLLAEDWTLGRLDSTLRAVLRAGAYELLMRFDIPARVVIDEYLEVAHAFFEVPEPALVNGVLDRLARNVRGQEFVAEKDDQA